MLTSLTALNDSTRQSYFRKMSAQLETRPTCAFLAIDHRIHQLYSLRYVKAKLGIP